MFHVSRFNGIEKRQYECEIVTPMFLGGADPRSAELRVPPIKGLLRFWWRAVCGIEDIKDMAYWEGEIFGSTEKKSKVSLWIENIDAQPRLERLPKGKKVPVEGKSYPTSIIHYLAYGFYERQGRENVFIKSHFPVQSRFKIVLQFSKGVTMIEGALEKSLKAMIMYGGLGARSRNGFGSLHCPILMDTKFSDYGPLKSYTSFSKYSTLFDKFKIYNKWEEALSEIGVAYRTARLNLEPKHTWQRRSFIAMPIEAKGEKIPDDIRNGRHAKPYFLHVNKTADGRYQGQILFLPYFYRRDANDTKNRIG